MTQKRVSYAKRTTNVRNGTRHIQETAYLSITLKISIIRSTSYINYLLSLNKCAMIHSHRNWTPILNNQITNYTSFRLWILISISLLIEQPTKKQQTNRFFSFDRFVLFCFDCAVAVAVADLLLCRADDVFGLLFRCCSFLK